MLCSHDVCSGRGLQSSSDDWMFAVRVKARQREREKKNPGVVVDAGSWLDAIYRAPQSCISEGLLHLCCYRPNIMTYQMVILTHSPCPIFKAPGWSFTSIMAAVQPQPGVEGKSRFLALLPAGTWRKCCWRPSTSQAEAAPGAAYPVTGACLYLSDHCLNK